MTFEIDDTAYLAHYGILRKSGRYPWGSGDNSVQRSKTFFDYIKEMLGFGLSEAEIAKGVALEAQHPFSSTDLRAVKSMARAEIKAYEINEAERLRAKGMGYTAIAKQMGKPESTVRSLLKPGERDKADLIRATANRLKEEVDRKGMIDVGKGNENRIGVSKERLATALAVLKAEGYEVHPINITQLGTGHDTRSKVLTKPGITQKEAWMNRDNIQMFESYSEDGGRTWFGIQPPKPIESSRVAVRYKEQGGDEADGVIYVREGVDDVSLGGVRYAQVRIAVDGTHYLKGMAMYKDDLPDGVDLVFNTNKSDTGNKIDAMKPLRIDKETGKVDLDNPFGSNIARQIGPTDEQGNVKKVTSVMNLVNEAGDWDDWDRNLSSQMLSKQRPVLAREQLEKTYKSRKESLDTILALTNPAVRKKLLEDFADDADAAAVHLKAAQLPRQRTQVILPVSNLKETEIYAPNFNHGERVALIRYPHGGTFEIPELTVNNNQRTAKSLIGQAPDAVGINSKVAARLSGADFDGDTVLVIPNPVDNPKIKTQSALEGLKKFDTMIYKNPEGTEFKGNKQQLMGDVSNLITDMTIAGADRQDLARAVRHSMVVIDSEKHNLNHQLSARVNGITQLKQKYQGAGNAGAATLISRRKSRLYVPERKERPAAEGGRIDPETGELMYVPTNRTRTKTTVNKRTGEVTTTTVPRQTRTTKLAEAKDARSLSSGTKMEEIYADHSNRLKALANTARREYVRTESVRRNPSAAKVYEAETKSLVAKLNTAQQNAPLERHAQVLAGAKVHAKKRANPDMTKEEIKKLEGMALKESRERIGAKKQKIHITDQEWGAIQAGAVSNHRLNEILNHADMDRVKQLATPRPKLLMSSAKTAQAQSLLSSGKTQAEVAKILGVSLTTLKDAL